MCGVISIILNHHHHHLCFLLCINICEFETDINIWNYKKNREIKRIMYLVNIYNLLIAPVCKQLWLVMEPLWYFSLPKHNGIIGMLKLLNILSLIQGWNRLKDSSWSRNYKYGTRPWTYIGNKCFLLYFLSYIGQGGMCQLSYHTLIYVNW